MYTITMGFYCTDHLSINHEVIRTFQGADSETVERDIQKFSRNLQDCGWAIVKCVEQSNLAHTPER